MPDHDRASLIYKGLEIPDHAGNDVAGSVFHPVRNASAGQTYHSLDENGFHLIS